jgi:exoribonuclease II
MTDEELIKSLKYLGRVTKDYDQQDMIAADYEMIPIVTKQAANRIEELTNTHWQVEAMHQNALLNDALTRAEAAEAKLAKAVQALRWVVSAKGLTDPTEYGYSAIKNARALLAEMEKTE